MHFLISGLAKSGTTRLFTQIQEALRAQGVEADVFFEPDTIPALESILTKPNTTLTKVLIGRVHGDNPLLKRFDRHVLIFRDPRDQFVSTLLYTFYDFQLNNDSDGFNRAYAALEKKVSAPDSVSAMELYNEVATLVGRPKAVVFKKLQQVQQEYIAALKPFLLRYEKLIDGEELTELYDYLGFSLPRDATVSNSYARVTRSKGYGDWMNWLTEEDQTFVTQEWGTYLQDLGYEPASPGHKMNIEESLSLAYVRQFDPG